MPPGQETRHRGGSTPDGVVYWGATMCAMTAHEQHQAPWPYLPAQAAADFLGVDVELVEGLAADRLSALRAYKTRGESRAIVWLVNKEDVEALKARMTA
jgi:hypothetical protein